MTNKVYESKYRNTVICVDSYQDKVMKGRIYNPYVEEPFVFVGTMSFLLCIEELLGQMNFPQAYEIKRSFGQFQTYLNQAGMMLVNDKGERGTFELKILFRQNASWQGTIHWKEEGKEESFRSVLELLLLMDSALRDT